MRTRAERGVADITKNEECCLEVWIIVVCAASRTQKSSWMEETRYLMSVLVMRLSQRH